MHEELNFNWEGDSRAEIIQMSDIMKNLMQQISLLVMHMLKNTSEQAIVKFSSMDSVLFVGGVLNLLSQMMYIYILHLSSLHIEPINKAYSKAGAKKTW